MRKSLIVCIAACVSCAPAGPVVLLQAIPEKVNFSVDSARVMADLEFISSKELEGREAGTKGEVKAGQYITSQLEKSGVKPYAFRETEGREPGYLQEFQSIKVSVDPTAKMTLFDSTRRRQKRLVYGDYFGIFHDQLVGCDFDAPIVFAGYGITAPEFKYDDYAGLDVRGKIVIALDGEPESDDDQFFYGPIASSYSSALFYKRHRAKEMGARAFIVMAYSNLNEQWSNTIDLFRSSRMFFGLETVAAGDTTLMPFYYANDAFFETILTKAPYSFSDLREIAARKEKLPTFQIPDLSVNLDVGVTVSKTKASNIVGWIEGIDPELKNEYVVIGAHYDHLGETSKYDVFNGADDDGSGTVAVMELGRWLATEHLNKRSVVLVLHSAEEKGLLGSEYFTDSETPRPFQMNQVVGMINLDMVGRERADSIHVIGSGRLSTELKQLTETANADLGLFKFDYTFDADDDPNQFYYRSDHYNYARLGIPVVFFYDGMTSDYHKTTDDFEKINYRKIENTIRLVHELVLRISNLDHRLVVDKKQ